MKYEIVFSESYISGKEASSRLSYASALSATNAPPADPSTSAEPGVADLSNISPLDGSTSPLDLHSPDRRPDRSSEMYERMVLDSRPYLCSIPQPPPPSTNATSSQKAAEEEAAELARATDRGWDLLQEMSGSCLYFISGWWSYSFCYAQSVKQFHPLPPGKGGAPSFPPAEDPTTPSYVLGKFGDRRVNAHRSGLGGAIGGGAGGAAEKEAGLGIEDRSGETMQVQAKGSSSSRYLSQKLSGGTTCDLTGAPRRVEIQFHCHPQSTDRIGWIREVSTCNYLMMVYTPRLCNDVAFSPPREEKAEQIICREVIEDGEEAGWEARKRREAEKTLVGDTAEAAKVNKPIIGGTEVGGMKQVGGEGRRLEIPQSIQSGSQGHSQMYVGNGVTAKIELVAKWDPKEKGGKVQRLSDEELKRMNMDVNVVDEARKKLESVAKKKRWRLEAFQADGGWQMRGIVEEDGGVQGAYEDEYTFEEVDEGYVDESEGGGNERQKEDEGNEEERGSHEEYKDEL